MVARWPLTVYPALVSRSLRALQTCKTLDGLDDYLAKCKRFYWGVSEATRFLHWLMDEERSKLLAATHWNEERSALLTLGRGQLSRELMAQRAPTRARR